MTKVDIRSPATALFLLALAGCDSQDAEGSSEHLVPTETPLITDALLDAAPVWRSELLTQHTETRDIAAESIHSPPRGVHSQQSPSVRSFGPGDAGVSIGRESTEGFVAFVETQARGHRYGLRLANMDRPNKPGTLIYRGRRPIDSVAVSADGQRVLFSAENEAGDFDVFLLDREGSLAGMPGGFVELPGTTFDEVHVSMSLDGETLAWQSFDEVTETTNYVFAQIDPTTGEITVTSVGITLSGIPTHQRFPALTGSGNDILMVADDEAAISSFGAPIILSFPITPDPGFIVYFGVSGLTTSLSDPSGTFDGEVVMFRETFDGIDEVNTYSPVSGIFSFVLYDTTAEHPYITADGSSFTFADDDTVFTSPVLFDTFDPTPVRPSQLSVRAGSSPFWAQPLPPPPPLPEGSIRDEGTTIGGSTFQRPELSGPLLADGQFAFDAFEFTIETDATGFYDVISEQTYDGYLHLYKDSFDPADPLANLIIGNDDLENNRLSGFSVALEAGEYILVTSAFEPGIEGDFTNRIVPRPVPAAGEAPVIEQLTETARVAEPGDFIEYSVFVNSTDAVSCEVDFGDGSAVETFSCVAGETTSVSHAFAADGAYVVTVTATSASGSASLEAFPTIATDDPDAFDVVVVFGNNEMSAAQRSAFERAAQRWSEIIVGDLERVDAGGRDLQLGLSCAGEPPFSGFADDVVVSAVGEAIDGVGAVLASAGPCAFRNAGTNGDLATLPTYGIMRFDIADLDFLEADGSLEDVVLHEMGHVLGIGTLWAANGFLTGTVADGADPNSPDYNPRYVAPVAHEEYEALLTDAGQSLEDTVPVANTGGPGTQEGHWREVTFDDELMTGFVAGAGNPLSSLTAGTLADLGYLIDFQSADPYSLPAPLADAVRVAPIGHDEIFVYGSKL